MYLISSLVISWGVLVTLSEISSTKLFSEIVAYDLDLQFLPQMQQVIDASTGSEMDLFKF